jgi:Lrp/AsnC family transcriptional regulator for asnA, asnC and gidA
MDEIDRKIVACLQQDGRASLGELAKSTGYTSMGVRRRLQKLLEKGTIKIFASLNPTQLSLLPAMVMLEMESAQAMNSLIERFKDCPRVVNIFKTIGGYNLIALVVAENRDMLECIAMEKCSLRSSPGIRRSEFYPISDVYYSPFLQVRENITDKDKMVKSCGVSCDLCVRYAAKKCPGCPSERNYRKT